MSEELLALAERCEKASGPDRELDYAISVAIGKGCVRSHKFLREDCAEETGGLTIPRYTSSLDDASSLVPEGWHASSIIQDRWKSEWWFVSLRKPGGHSATVKVRGLPLALCAAALRARAHP